MTPFDDLIADPFAQKRYLAILEPFDPGTGGTVALYVGDAGFTTGPGDTPANQYFEPRLVSALNFERSLFQGGTLGGRSIPDFGVMTLNNADGGLDGWQGYNWDGRRARVYLGGDGFGFAEYGLIFDGLAEDIDYGDLTLSVRLQDLSRKLDLPIQVTTYAGTGGAEGGDELKGKPKPLVFGRVFHISAVPVDPAALLYQVHDGAIEDVTAAYDRGQALTKVGGSPVAGEFSVDTSAGTITLGASPAGVITADVKGDKTGGAYVETTGSVIRRIAVARGGFADPGDLDTASFTALDTVNSADIGIAITDEQGMGAALDYVAGSIGAYYGFDRAGKLSVGRIEAPAGSSVASFTDVEILELERRPTARPIWRQHVGYGRYWRPTDRSDTESSALSDAEKADLEQEYRVEEAEDVAVRTAHLLAEDERRDTGLALAVDAASEAARLLALFKIKRDVFRMRVKTQPFSLSLGQTIAIRYPRHGLDGARNLVIVGLTEDSAVNEVELELWG